LTRFKSIGFADSKIKVLQTDKNKKKLVDKSTEMLCLKEDCFDVVKKGQNFKIFNNKVSHCLKRSNGNQG